VLIKIAEKCSLHFHICPAFSFFAGLPYFTGIRFEPFKNRPTKYGVIDDLIIDDLIN
jgi:hypothetical protein